MKQEKGLLLFVCVLLMLAAAVSGLPLLSAAERLARVAEGLPNEAHLLGQALRPPGSGKVYAHERQALLQEVIRDRRPDERLARLAADNHLSPADLKAFLAANSRGVADQEGMFWASPLGVAEQSDRTAEERCLEAARQLGELKRRAGSFEAAVLGWVVGPERAARLAGLGGAKGEIAAAARLFLTSPLRDRAIGLLCLVRTLRAGLSAAWPVEPGAARVERERLLLAARPGEAVAAPLSGTARHWEYGCLLVEHGCGLCSELCGLSAPAPVGARLEAGQRLGTATGSEVGFGLLLGGLALDGRVLTP